MRYKGKASVSHLIICDEQDEDFVRNNNWSLSNGYPSRRKDKKLQYLHILIAGTKEGFEVDHENGNKLDVRRSNLRHLTHHRNTQNLHGRKNQSIARGVSRCKRSGKYKAYSSINGKQHFIGRFDTPEKAAEMAREFRAKHMPDSTT